MKKNVILIFLSSVLLLYGCKKENNPTEPSLPSNASIADAKAFWESKNIKNYVLEQTTASWYPWSGDSVRIRVMSDTMNSVTSLRANSTLNTSLWGQYKTVKQLFAIAEQDTSIYEIRWELDAEYGYPNMLYFMIKPPPMTEGGIKITTYNFACE
jgi:hypothetical protein